MPEYEILYYISEHKRNVIKEFLESLSLKQKEKVFRVFTHIQEYGLRKEIHQLKKITKTSLWELRILGKDNIRLLCVSLQNKRVLILHGFLKKSQKLPLHECNVAQKRLEQYLDN
ncbi:MAG TPA: hypothetical protein DCX25_00940 [Candidatus Pacebacteria bacterium]|nr:MAG: hypothetical protein UX00_C0015G0010 [Microgenomates group bacterium GW2011_GWB1_45_17]KKU22765.1 MAG: hypothetical protein UX35_C0016G0009 [Microgenomates group bacterium GW2011_GWA1_46_15]KKU24027.1 MAG: hypothetical protein UX36_C0002G0010 [Microgenomates group bacterium GW2011_GWC1_46_15]HAV14879.1 hypothetical protein [Candidatus Paceibacterota bacterium]HCR11625.1 hypothetical protein [Candidatus Paceibacterota bacterium]